MKLLRNIFLVIGLLVLSIVLEMRYHTRTLNGYEVKLVDGDIFKFINEEVINEQVAALFRKDSSYISDFDLKKYEALLEEHPHINNAEIYVHTDGKIGVEVEQSHPIGRVYSGKGSFYICEDAQLIPVSSKYAASVPIVSGHYSQKNEKDVYALLSHIREDKLLCNQITGIYVHKGNQAHYDLMGYLGGHRIELGTLQDMDRKLEKLKSFYATQMAGGDWKRYKKINLTFKDQVVCTKR